jgi:sporulation protein YlmC with PRC-barrel domain
MSSIVSCKGKLVWKYGAGADDAFLGLTSIPKATGVGKVYNAAFDHENTDEYGEFSWKEVSDPMKEDVHGEVLIIEPDEVAKIKEYIVLNSPKTTLLQKITKKSPETNSLIEMLNCTLEHLSTNEKNEVFFVW